MDCRRTPVLHGLFVEEQRAGKAAGEKKSHEIGIRMPVKRR